MNLLIRRCFEPDSIAFMKPAAVEAGVFDFDGKDGEVEGEEGEDLDAHPVHRVQVVGEGVEPLGSAGYEE